MKSGSTAFPDTHACARCGTYHTARQRCPMDRPLPPPVELPRSLSIPAPAPTAPVLVRRPRRPGFERYVLAWWGGGFGTIVLIACLSIAGVGIADLTVPDADIAGALTTIGVSVAVGALFGMFVMYVSARRYAKFMFAALALFLVSAGAMMLVFAPVLRQMNSPDVAEYRAFSVLLWSGSATLVAGLALATICVRWASQRHARQWLSRRSRRLGFIWGLLQGVIGVIAVVALTVAFFTSSRAGEPSVAQESVGIATTGAILLIPAIILLYAGFRGARGKASHEFRLPPALVAIVAFAAVLALGAWFSYEQNGVAMPLLHVAAGIIPAAALVTLAARGALLRGAPVRSLTRRQVLLAAAISMTVGVWFAVYFEALGGFAAVILLLVNHGAFEGAHNGDAVFTAIGEAAIILSRNEQFVVNLVSAALLAPVFEEFGKALGVRFLMRPNMGRAHAFVLGAAAGAGFGFLESQLYGLTVIQEDLGDWWIIMLLRGGSTSLHVLATGLVGLAWWYWSYGRRHRLAAGLFGVAVALHALWNGFAVTLYSRVFGLETLSDRAVDVIAFTVVAVISLAMVVAIPMVARRLRERSVVPSTPLASMSPWLG